jgi:hypothetical protein
MQQFALSMLVSAIGCLAVCMPTMKLSALNRLLMFSMNETGSGELYDSAYSGNVSLDVPIRYG